MVGYYQEKWTLSDKPKTTKLFLAEGDAEVGFLENALLRNKVDQELVTILCFKGLSRLGAQGKTLAKLLDQDGAVGRLKAIGVVADSETDPAARTAAVVALANAFGFEKCDHALRTNNRVEAGGRLFGFHFSPTPDLPGRIEDLVMREIAGHPEDRCLSQVVPCLFEIKNEALNSKAYVQMIVCAKTNGGFSGLRMAFNRGLLNSQHEAYASINRLINDVLAY